MSILKLLFSLFLFVVLVIVAGLGYLGFVPGISTLMGADKPRDLKVRFTEETRKEARSKSKVEYGKLPANTSLTKSIQYVGKRDITAYFTNEELSALASVRPWKYYPFTKVQLKFYGDGSAEASAVLLKGKVSSWLAAMSVPKVAVEYISKALVVLPERIPVYVKGYAALSENKVSKFDIKNLEIGRLPAPVETVNKYKESIVSFINDHLGQLGGFYAKDAHFEEGKLFLDGSLSEKELTVQ